MTSTLNFFRFWTRLFQVYKYESVGSGKADTNNCWWHSPCWAYCAPLTLRCTQLSQLETVYCGASKKVKLSWEVLNGYSYCKSICKQVKYTWYGSLVWRFFILQIGQHPLDPGRWWFNACTALGLLSYPNLTRPIFSGCKAK